MQSTYVIHVPLHLTSKGVLSHEQNAQLAALLFQCYCRINPLNLSDGTPYWLNVETFLRELQLVLLDDAHPNSFNNILTEHYLMLCKLCVEVSFKVSDILKMDMESRNVLDVLATEIAYHILPMYVMNLRQRYSYVAYPYPFHGQSQRVATESAEQPEGRTRPRIVRRVPAPKLLPDIKPDRDTVPLNFYTAYCPQVPSDTDVGPSVPIMRAVPQTPLIPTPVAF